MAYGYMNTKCTPYAYRIKGMAVFFTELDCLPLIEKVIDESGQILNFPGIEEREEWVKEQKIGFHRDVRFESKFIKLNENEYLMIWMLQPNGWHWVDSDGFGFCDDKSISFYTLLDSDGNFKSEFKLFSIDKKRYTENYSAY